LAFKVYWNTFDGTSNARPSHHLNFKFGTAAVLNRELGAGEPFDVAILTPPMIEGLAKEGKVVGTSAAIVAKIGIGAAVKAGATKPPIEARDALRTTLLSSPGVAYTKEPEACNAFIAYLRSSDVLGELRKQGMSSE
jgi:hypothetical protein